MTTDNTPLGYMGDREAYIRNVFFSDFGLGKPVTVDDVYDKLMTNTPWTEDVLFQVKLLKRSDDLMNDFDQLPRGYERLGDLVNAAAELEKVAEGYDCNDYPDETRRFAEELHAFATREFVSDEQLPNEVVLQEMINEFVNVVGYAVSNKLPPEEYMLFMSSLMGDRMTQLLYNNPKFTKEFFAHDYDTHVVRLDICNDCRVKELMNPDED